MLADHTAGDPMRPGVKWTNLSRRRIALQVTCKGTPVSRGTVSVLLHSRGYRLRKAVKAKVMGSHPDRDKQFRNNSVMAFFKISKFHVM